MTRRYMYFFTIMLLCYSRPGFAAAEPGLTPEPVRITDEAISSDIRSINALQKRLADVNTSGTPIGTYHFAKAQAWIDMAQDEYAMNDRTSVIEDTVKVANELITQLEGNKSNISMDTPILPTSRKIRNDLWQKAAEWKQHPGFPCGEDLVAQLEVQLVWAGHEDNQLGWRHAKPYLQAAERLAREAGRKIENCPAAERIKVAMGTAVEGGADKVSSASQPVAAGAEPITPAAGSVPKPTGPAAETCSPRFDCPPVAAAAGTMPDRVHFALNRDIISPRSAAVLQRVAAVMNADPAIKLELRGHADERGHRVFNHVLSRQRAEVVRTYLMSAGVERSRITVKAFGENSPFVRGNDIVSYAQNRRVELVFSGSEAIKIAPQYEDVQVEKVRK